MARRTELVFVGIALAAAITGVVAYTYSKDAPAKDADAEARPLVGSGGAIAASAGPVEVPRRHEVVDPSYQFTLTAPGPGWEVFDREESDAIWFGVLASAASTDGVIQVSIQQTGDLTLEVAGDRVQQALGRTPTKRRAIRWLDRDALELEFGGDDEARRERVFVRGGMLHQVSFIPGGITDDWSAVDADTAWAAFTLGDGAPHATTPTFPPRDVAGPGWRLRGRTWESAVAGITITPPAEWRVITDLADGEGDVQLVNDAVGCSISLDSYAGAATVPAADARRFTIDTLGGTALLSARETDPIFRLWSATAPVGTIKVGLQAWCPRDAADTESELRRAFASIGVMPELARAALARELGRQRNDRAATGATWALRNGTYVDYESGLIWKRPSANWQISTGSAAHALLEGAVLVVFDPRIRIMISIAADDTVLDPAAGITKWADEHVFENSARYELGQANPRLQPGREGFWTDTGGERHLHRVLALVGDAHAFRVHVDGTPATLREHEPEIIGALAALAIDPVAATEERGGGFIDRRFGFQASMPPGWARTDDVGATSVDRTWERDSELITIVAEISNGRPGDRFTQMRARLRSSAAVGAGTAPRPLESTSVLAGEPAVKLSWHEDVTAVHVLLVEQDDVRYTVFTRGTDATLELARKAFRFVARPD